MREMEWTQRAGSEAGWVQSTAGQLLLEATLPAGLLPRQRISRRFGVEPSGFSRPSRLPRPATLAEAPPATEQIMELTEYAQTPARHPPRPPVPLVEREAIPVQGSSADQERRVRHRGALLEAVAVI